MDADAYTDCDADCDDSPNWLAGRLPNGNRVNDPRSAHQHPQHAGCDANAGAGDLDVYADQSRVYDPATYIDSGDSLHADGQAGGTARSTGSGGAGGRHLPE